MSNQKKSFVMMIQWGEQLNLLTNEQKGILLTAIYDYQLKGEDFVTDDGMLAMLWALVKQTFVYNDEKYAERCRKNRESIRKRWNNTNVYERIQPSTNDTYNDNEYDNEYDNDNESENDDASSSLTLGKFNNIIISQSEYDAFRHDYPRIFSQEIERLSAYMKSTDKSYSNHYATLVRWADADSKKVKNDKPQIAATYDIDKIAKDALFNDDYEI